MPAACIDTVITDPMFGVAANARIIYDWGPDPCDGSPADWWAYHRPYYEECRRVLKPTGNMAWAMGCKFAPYFPGWFGDYRIWSLTRFKSRGMNAFWHVWVVQTAAQAPIRFPDKDALIVIDTKPELLKYHPCAKTINEMYFLVESLSEQGHIVFDPFAGIGSTLVAAERLNRPWVGCDLSANYGRVALRRLEQERKKRGES
jgi:DNA modification methylase